MTLLDRFEADLGELFSGFSVVNFLEDSEESFCRSVALELDDQPMSNVKISLERLKVYLEKFIKEPVNRFLFRLSECLEAKAEACNV